MKITILSILLISSICGSSAMESNLSTVDYLKLLQQSQTMEQECSTISNSISNIAASFYQMGSGVSLQCQIHLQATAFALKLVFDYYILGNMDQYLSNVDGIRAALIEIQKQSSSGKTLSKENLLHLIVSAIRRRDFQTALNIFLENKTIPLGEIVHEIYNKNVSNAEILIQFFNSLANINQQIDGYRLIFDEMKQNNHEYNTATTIIAYKVIHDFKKTHGSNDNVIYLLNNLQNTVKALSYNSLIFIENLKYKTNCMVPSVKLYDNIKHNVFILPNRQLDQSKWKLIPVFNETFFIIESNYFGPEYLIASESDFASNGNQFRRVFSKPDKNMAIKNIGNWQLHPIESSEYFKIKNVYLNEYLHIEDGFEYQDDKSFKFVFTSKSRGDLDHDGYKWKILNA